MPSSDNHYTVADLMSRGAQTFDPAARLDTIVRKMRLIGHEGYPVSENGRVVGLLTRRDADRAVEHGLGDLSVRDVMLAGKISLRPDDPISLLERRMVESGWGQIPVVDADGKIIGIVTRTDLIKHWAQVHPVDNALEAETISPQKIAAVLGQPIADLIERVAQEARDQQLNLYLVGGLVRDLLLQRPNADIDFVVEADAIRFAEGLQARFGGQMHSYRPFGTATWHIATRGHDPGDATGNDLPDHVDFASARSEFYEHPTALPTVYTSSIKRDLYRRDFTINTLAVQLSPAEANGRILDEYGGLEDLHAGLIRVLHSLSFVDDPTRILRAVRFERRLGFQIEPRTRQLIETALPMLRRITGERVRNELTLMLGENDPAGGFLLLQARGILKAIHPAFVISADLLARFERARSQPWPAAEPHDLVDLYWCVMLATIPVTDLTDLCARLMFAKSFADVLLQTAQLVQNLDGLDDPDLPPSRIATRLDSIDILALYAAQLILNNGFSIVPDRIWRYANSWRGIRPITDGHTLRARGLKPGPCYTLILSRLRAARLDGEISTDAEESRLLDTLIEGGICNDGAE